MNMRPSLTLKAFGVSLEGDLNGNTTEELIAKTLATRTDIDPTDCEFLHDSANVRTIANHGCNQLGKTFLTEELPKTFLRKVLTKTSAKKIVLLDTFGVWHWVGSRRNGCPILLYLIEAGR